MNLFRIGAAFLYNCKVKIIKTVLQCAQLGEQAFYLSPSKSKISGIVRRKPVQPTKKFYNSLNHLLCTSKVHYPNSQFRRLIPCNSSDTLEPARNSLNRELRAFLFSQPIKAQPPSG